ncbi:MAG: hypothetical protein WBW04_16335 [Nitrolancea sp.]
MLHPADSHDMIRVHGARVNNLKNIVVSTSLDRKRESVNLEITVRANEGVVVDQTSGWVSLPLCDARE